MTNAKPQIHFKGSIPASKSVLNRALIVQSYFPELQISGDSRCDDVLHMKQSLQQVSSYQNMLLNAGEGGTTFRFLALRASRTPGAHRILAHPRLLRRPQDEIITLLSRFGVKAELSTEGMNIFSKGWVRPEEGLVVNCSESSQYASSLVLNAWSLPFELKFSLSSKKVSEGYFDMTLEMLKELGMQIHRQGDQITIPANQEVRARTYFAEPDMSSIFTIAAAGALAGEVQIENFPAKSSQPDRVFLKLFEQMKVEFRQEASRLQVKESSNLHPLQCNLKESPDLFPVLAILCAFAKGESKLYGAPQLAHKESNRIDQISKLFHLVGIPHQPQADGMIIQGGNLPPSAVPLSFDPDQDHRMVMAAELLNLRWQNPNFKVLHPEVVNKSLPEFFEILGTKL